MKAVILAGGLGTRLGEETDFKPKPMVEVGGRPLLWHIMKIYSQHGINDFVVCLGYRGYLIKEYFQNYFAHMSDFTIDLQTNQKNIHQSHTEPWKITLVDTGADTMTGGRVKRIREHVADEAFLLTYGDGVGNIDITETLRFHREHGRLCTVTAVQPPGRFGALDLSDDGHVRSFIEKPRGDGTWINGGFFVVDPRVLDLVEGDATIWEQGPLVKLAAQDQLVAYKHRDFWQPMDTLRDKRQLEALWAEGKAPWRTW